MHVSQSWDFLYLLHLACLNSTMEISVSKYNDEIRIVFSGDGWESYFYDLSAVKDEILPFGAQPDEEYCGSVIFSEAEASIAEDWLHQKLRKNTDNLNTLNIYSYPLNLTNVKLFAEDLQLNSTLKNLHLDYNTIKDEGISLLSAIANSSLEHVNLVLDRTRSTGWKLLGQALAHQKSIKELAVRDHTLGIGLGDATTAVDFFNFLATNTVLTSLETSLRRYSPEDIDALGEGLKHNSSLTSLKLSHPSGRGIDCEIGPLGDALKLNTTIKQLLLHNVTCTHEAHRRFSEGLAANTSLTGLDFYKTQFTPESFDLLSEGLQANKSLQKLIVRLPDNSTLIEFSRYLRTTKTLWSLTVTYSDTVPFSPAAVSELHTAFSENKSIKRLNFPIRLESFWRRGDFFSSILKRNRTMKKLKVSNLTLPEIHEIISTNDMLSEIRVIHCLEDLTDLAANNLKAALSNNYSLFHAYVNYVINIPDISNRNRALQKQRYEDTALIIHVITRSHLFTQLPVELWLLIFSMIRYAGLDSFEQLATSVMKQRNNEL